MNSAPGDEVFEFIRVLPDEHITAIDDYLYCKERALDYFLDVDPWDYVSSGRFDDEAFRNEIKRGQTETAHYEKEFKESIARLRQLEIDPEKVDALRLTNESLDQITDMLRNINTTNTNNDMEKGNEPLRKLPTLWIHDTEFYVDLEKLQFRQIENPANTISFYDVQDNGDHTVVMYDMKTKNAFQGTWGEMTAREDVIPVRLPSAVDLDFDYVIGKLNERSEEMYRQRQQQQKASTSNSDASIRQPKQSKPTKGPGL